MKNLNMKNQNGFVDVDAGLVKLIIGLIIFVITATFIGKTLSDRQAAADEYKSVKESLTPEEILSYEGKVFEKYRSHLWDDYITASGGSRESITKTIMEGTHSTLKRKHIQYQIEQNFTESEIKSLEPCYENRDGLACEKAVEQLN